MKNYTNYYQVIEDKESSIIENNEDKESLIIGNNEDLIMQEQNNATEINIDNFVSENELQDTEITEIKDDTNVSEVNSEISEDQNNVVEEQDESHTGEVNEKRYVKVISNALNVRKDPNKESDILTIVYKDELLELIDETIIDGFYCVKTKNDFTGYCMVNFVELV